jgi:hypothetical protein
MNKLNGISIQHNLTERDLHFCMENLEEKLVSPCLAVVKNENLLESFGEIKLLSYKNDEVMMKSKIYSSDIYSPRMDFLNYKINNTELVKHMKDKYNIDCYCQDKYYNDYSFGQEHSYQVKKELKELHPKYEESVKMKKKSRDLHDKVTFASIKPKGTLPEEKEKRYETIKENISDLREEIYDLEYNDDYEVIKSQKMNEIKILKEEENLLNEERYLDPQVLEEWESVKLKTEKRSLNHSKKYRKIEIEINDFVHGVYDNLLNDFKEEGLFVHSGDNRSSGKRQYKRIDNRGILRRLKKNLVNGESFEAPGFIYLRNRLADNFTYSQYHKNDDYLASNEEESLDSQKEFENYILENYKGILKDIETDEDKLIKFYDMFKEGEIQISISLRMNFNNIFKSHYFEAKPQREVEFNEFEIALIPDNRDEKTIKFLQKNNLKIFKYKNKEKENISEIYKKVLKKLEKEK